MESYGLIIVSFSRLAFHANTFIGTFFLKARLISSSLNPSFFILSQRSLLFIACWILLSFSSHIFPFLILPVAFKYFCMVGIHSAIDSSAYSCIRVLMVV